MLDRAVPAAYAPRPGRRVAPYSVETAQRTLAFVARTMNERRTRALPWWDVMTWVPHAAAVTLAWVGPVTSGNAAVFGLAAFVLLTPLIWVGLTVFERTGSADLPVTPLVSARADVRTATAGGLLAATVMTAVFLFGYLAQAPQGLPYGVSPVVGHTVLVMVASTGMAVTGFSRAWHTASVQVFLTVRHRTPVRLMHFLEDARSRHLMRTVGPVYQFRHATLQDRLAGVATADSGTTTWGNSPAEDH